MEPSSQSPNIVTILLTAVSALTSVVAYLFQTAWKSRSEMIDRMAQSVAKTEAEADELRKELAEARRQYAALQERAMAAGIEAGVFKIVVSRDRHPDHQDGHPPDGHRHQPDPLKETP